MAQNSEPGIPIGVLFSTVVSVVLGVTGLVAAAFTGVRKRQDDTDARVSENERDIAMLKQAMLDHSRKSDRLESKVDDLSGAIHSIDKNLATLVAQTRNPKP